MKVIGTKTLEGLHNYSDALLRELKQSKVNSQQRFETQKALKEVQLKIHKKNEA